MKLSLDQRRGFLALSAGAVLVGLTRLSPTAWAESKSSKTTGGASADPAALNQIAKTAAECIRTGEACLSHCHRELAKGNTEMGKCAESVREMLSLTRAMLELSAAGSPYAAKLAALCAEACKSCAAACAEHKAHFAHGMHGECKACLEACEACEKACRKLMA